MKLKTFVRKVPLLFGAVLLIAVFFFASCEESKQDDGNKNTQNTEETQRKETKEDKTTGGDRDARGITPEPLEAEDEEPAPEEAVVKTAPTLRFALGDTSEVDDRYKGTKYPYARKQTTGGVEGDKTYYQVSPLDSTKHFTLTAIATASTGAITYELWSVVGRRAHAKIDDEDTATVDESTGRVVIKTGKDVFYYFKAKIEETDTHTAGEKQVLVIAGLPPMPPDAAVLDKNSLIRNGYTEAMGGFGTKAGEQNDIVHAQTALGTGDASREGKKFTLRAKFDSTQFPLEAPLPVFLYELGTTGTNSENVAVDIGRLSGEVTLGNAAESGNSVNVQVETADFFYSLAPKELYSIKVP